MNAREAVQSLKLKIAGTVDDSIVDGPGIRYTVFTQGCPHRCPGCHNPQTHDPEGGQWVTIGQIAEQMEQNPLLMGVTFSGGEPFSQPHPLAALAKLAKARGLNVICYTGWTFEQLLQQPEARELLEQVDWLIDGRFVLEQRDLTLPFRGSRNQRVLHCPESLRQGKAVVATEDCWK